jgi:menaquinone-specific isochorismate synthase
VTPRSPRQATPELVGVRFGLEHGALPDPFSLAGDHGWLLRSGRLTLVGVGCAARLSLPEGLEDPAALDAVVSDLAAIECDDRIDATDRHALPAPVLALGALPFDRGAAAALAVPHLTFGATNDGRAWCTVVATDRNSLPDSLGELTERLVTRVTEIEASRPDPDGDRHEIAAIVARSNDDEFEELVAEAITAIDAGELAKVVLARQVDVAMTGPIELPALLRRWSRLEPACTVFSVPVTEGQFVGASPELLVARSEGRVRSRPLAGTTGSRPGDDPDLGSAALFDSSKDVTEHRLVVEAIAGALGPLSRDLDTPERPELVRLRSMTHLGTEISGTLDTRADGSTPHVLEVLAALHPTPAVGGVPGAAARAMIERLEPVGRGPYAGPVGFVDAVGDGRWVVGIRSATVAGADARLAAGVGIVKGSDPRSERAETDLKFRSVLDALAPGVAPAERPLARR